MVRKRAELPGLLRRFIRDKAFDFNSYKQLNMVEGIEVNIVES